MLIALVTIVSSARSARWRATSLVVVPPQRATAWGLRAIVAAQAAAIRCLAGRCWVLRYRTGISLAWSWLVAPPWVRRTKDCASSRARSRRRVACETASERASSATLMSPAPANRSSTAVNRWVRRVEVCRATSGETMSGWCQGGHRLTSECAGLLLVRAIPANKRVGLPHLCPGQPSIACGRYSWRGRADQLDRGTGSDDMPPLSRRRGRRPSICAPRMLSWREVLVR